MFSSFSSNSPDFRLYGCYENLVGGHLSDALQDVSGGVAETINVEKFLNSVGIGGQQTLFKTVKEAFDNEALIVAAIAVGLSLVPYPIWRMIPGQDEGRN